MKQEQRSLAAPCGLYCGACFIYLACHSDDKTAIGKLADSIKQQQGIELDPDTDLQCEGCLSSRVAWYCRTCNIRDCAADKGLTHCAKCDDSLCERITTFSEDGWPHHSEVLKNIRSQKESGIESWLQEHKEQWLCSNCGNPLGWYDKQCGRCGSITPERFS